MDPRDAFERNGRRGVGPMERSSGRSGALESVQETVFKRTAVPVADALPRALEFRRKTKSWFSFPYHCLMNTEYHPHDRVVLTFSTHQVVLLGRNLQSVYDGIREQKHARIEEMDRATRLATAEEEPEIHTIEVEDLRRRRKEPESKGEATPEKPST